MNKCKMRSDIYESGYGISINDGQQVYYGDEELEYKWDEDENFFVLLDGEFQPAESIDFEFIDYGGDDEQ
jgi:hypothetical protein